MPDYPEDVPQDQDFDPDQEGQEGDASHHPRPAFPGIPQPDMMLAMQDMMDSLKGHMDRKTAEWERRQESLLARLRKEEEERVAARAQKEALDDARRAKELESLRKMVKGADPAKPATPQPRPKAIPPFVPPTAPPTRPPTAPPMGDSEPESETESECSLDEEPRDPLEGQPQDPQPNSPPDDQAQFCGMLQRAAARFGIATQQDEPLVSILTDKLNPAMKQVTQLPVDPLIWKRGLEVLAKPASAPSSNPRQERKYRVPESDPLCLRGIPPPDSIVATAARKRAASSSLSSQSGPPEKEHRKLDTVGRKVCTAAALTVREANAMGIVARYTRDLWDCMEGFVHLFPEEVRQQVCNTIAEGKVCANHGVKMALDVADSGFHSMAHGVALRRHGWLQASGFKPDIQHKLVDMPFDGQQLFGKQVEDSIAKTKGELETMKGVPGLQQPQQQQARKKKPFRTSQKQPQQGPKGDRSWPSTSKGNGNYRGNARRGRGGGSNNRAPPKDKA